MIRKKYSIILIVTLIALSAIFLFIRSMIPMNETRSDSDPTITSKLESPTPKFDPSLTDWQSFDGTWSINESSMLGNADGDAFNMASVSASNFIYEADVKFVGGNKTAALIFRSNGNGSQGYAASIDVSSKKARVFKLPKTGDLVLGSSPIDVKDKYHLKVHVEGNHIQFYLDDQLIINVVDTTYTRGQFGLNINNSEVEFNNINVQYIGEEPEDGKGDGPDYYAEKYRPQYHFSPEKGWLNDPNGMVFFEGEYHLFYQYHPSDKLPGPMHWGHAVSEDMVHWKNLPTALYPDQFGNIYSGSAVVDWNDTSGFFDGGSGLVAIFTHAGKLGQIQSIAYSKDKGRTWTKYKENPVIDEFSNEDFRDPKVFWHEGTNKWIMVVAGGKVRFYSSPNLIDWKWESDNDIWAECPDLFQLAVDGDSNHTKWVLNLGGGGYYIGTFDGIHFTPESDRLPINYGPDSYAAQTFSDEPNGRRIMINWMNSWGYAKDLADTTDPWNGAMTLPYELSLKTYPEGIRLIQQPIAELQQLRSNHHSYRNETIKPNDNILENLRGESFEVVAEFELDTATEFGLKVRKGDNEETVVGYNVVDQILFLDRHKSGEMLTGKYEAMLIPENNRVKMHLFLDWSSIEVFGNGGKTIFTNLIFPNFYSNGLELYAKEGNVRVISLDVFELKSVWREDDDSITSPLKLHLSRNHIDLPYGETAEISAGIFPRHIQSNKISWTSSNPEIALVESDGTGKAIIKAVDTGQTTLTAEIVENGLTASATVDVFKPQLDTNLSQWKSNGGVWKIKNGMEGRIGGDIFNIASETAADLIYEADLKFISGNAASLIFRSNKDGTRSYAANINLELKEARLFMFPTVGDYILGTSPIDVKNSYHIKIIAKGDRIQYYLDDKLIIDVNDNTYASGQFGLNIYYSTIQFDNIFYYE